MSNIVFNSGAIDRLKSASGIYIWGTNRLGYNLAQGLLDSGLTFLGFIDSYKHGKSVQLCGKEIKVSAPDEIADKHSKTLIISGINQYMEIYDKAVECGFKDSNIVDTMLLYDCAAPEQEDMIRTIYSEWLVHSICNDYPKNKQKYAHLNKILSDERSKDVLSAVIKLADGDTRPIDVRRAIAAVSEDEAYQYEEFMTASGGGGVFADCGSYDGTNSIAFMRLNPNYKKIYAFEPDAHRMKWVKEALSDYSGVEYLAYGCSDMRKRLKFHVGVGGEVSMVRESGEQTIECVPLDDVVKEDKAFIKMDIEGAEMDAILGAKRLFTNGSPFAISVYHRAGDIWKIPERILGYNPNYKLYLRKYGSKISEVVLFGVS
ncbi:hypothetical protein AGMMS49941_01460 [Deferribacterales bacterium]|nr:hypothetical protein AGMMS49941_01460 [Deferribacterales bacterium]